MFGFRGSEWEGGKGRVQTVVYGGVPSAFEGVWEVICLGEAFTTGFAPFSRLYAHWFPDSRAPFVENLRISSWTRSRIRPGVPVYVPIVSPWFSAASGGHAARSFNLWRTLNTKDVSNAPSPFQKRISMERKLFSLEVKGGSERGVRHHTPIIIPFQDPLNGRPPITRAPIPIQTIHH